MAAIVPAAGRNWIVNKLVEAVDTTADWLAVGRVGTNHDDGDSQLRDEIGSRIQATTYQNAGGGVLETIATWLNDTGVPETIREIGQFTNGTTGGGQVFMLANPSENTVAPGGSIKYTIRATVRP